MPDPNELPVDDTRNDFYGEPDSCAGKTYCPDPFMFSLNKRPDLGPACGACHELDDRWGIAWGDVEATSPHATRPRVLNFPRTKS